MTLDEELAAWGEPPASSEEKILADMLDEIIVLCENEPTTHDFRVRHPELSSELLDKTLCDLRLVARSAGSFLQLPNLTSTLKAPATEIPSPIYPQSIDFPRQLSQGLQNEYERFSWLGTGSYGEVWKAWDIHFLRWVAIKAIKPRDTPAKTHQALELMRAEAQKMNQLQHPNIVKVFAWRVCDSQHYLIMQCIEGTDLSRHVSSRGVLPWASAARYLADVSEALLEVHNRGVIHRDIKPANILLDSQKDEAYLTDFGIATRLDGEQGVGGTPSYMAPEGWDAVISPAMDVYSLAATLFFSLTGQAPFVGKDATELRQRQRLGLPKHDRRLAAVPDSLEKIIRLGLESDPLKRPQLSEFAATLRASLNHSLADDLAYPLGGSFVGNASVDLRIIVSRHIGGNRYVPLTTVAAQPVSSIKDARRIPRPPEQVTLRTGERIRIQVDAKQTGYLTVLNVGPSGHLSLLYPVELEDSSRPVHAGAALSVIDAQLKPPTGRERIVALWTREPLPLDTDELRESGRTRGVKSSYHSTRDIEKVKQSVRGLRSENWHAVVLDIDHIGPGER